MVLLTIDYLLYYTLYTIFNYDFSIFNNPAFPLTVDSGISTAVPVIANHH